MRIFLSIVFMICVNIAIGQVTTFQKIIYGDSTSIPLNNIPEIGYSIENTTNNGYIIGGMRGSLQGALGLVIKLDKNGDTLWTNTLRNGTSNQTVIYDVTETSDNGFIATGKTQFFNWPYYDIILAKLDNNGNLLWTKVFSGSSQHDIGFDVLETLDGNYVIAGFTESSPGFSEDVYIIKTNHIGDTIWTRIIGGGMESKVAKSISLTEDNGYIVSGNISGYGAGSDDGLMLKINSNGNLLWAKTFGSEGIDYINSCVILENDTIVFAGKSNDDFWLTKATPDGDILWTKHIGTAGTDEAYDITITNDNGFAMGGLTLGGPPGVPNMYLVKTNYNGDTLWTKSYGENGGDLAHSVIETPDNGCAMVGYTGILQGENPDLYFVKTDATGNSGCHEYSTVSITSNISIQTTSLSLPVVSGGEIESLSLFKTSGMRVTTECFTVGINQKSEKETYKLYPNPAHQLLSLSFDNPEQCKYLMNIYDMQGRLVKSIPNISTYKTTIDISGLTNGLHLLQLRADGKTCLTGKFVKE